jgi:hypothetical protein
MRVHRFFVLSVIILFLCCTGKTNVKTVPKPESIIGFEIGTENKLAHPTEIIEYFKELDKASDRLVFEEVGRTTDDNPFVMAYISSEENIRNLEKYKEITAKLSDPRKITDEEAKELIKEGKTIVCIAASIHATEVGPAQMAVRLAYVLCSDNSPEIQRILDNIVLVLIPMHNPDGYKMVVDWMRKYQGTEYAGSELPYLYHRYTGHDNNRDWYMFTQKETQLTIKKLYNVWHPQIVMDCHQKGGGARIFVPPYEAPYEPNVDPIITANVNMIGTYMMNRMTTKGYGGVESLADFDAWTPGRAYQHYHGAIRILTEVASAVNLAGSSYVTGKPDKDVFYPMPWKEGKWGIKEIIDYDYEAALAMLENAALLRDIWLSNFYEIQKKAVAEKFHPYAAVIPAKQRDPYTTKWLIDVLQFGGVEIYKAPQSFSAEGKSFDAGSAIIYMNQPYYGFAKTLLERQKYPELRQYPGGPLKRPYDTVAHTLPLLMGVDVQWIDSTFTADKELMVTAEVPQPVIPEETATNGYIVSHSNNAHYIALNRLLGTGVTAFWTAERFKDGSVDYPAGTIILYTDDKNAERVKTTARELTLDLIPRKSADKLSGYKLEPVKIGLYKAWSGNINEGWTRWVLEKFEFHMESAHNDIFKAGKLNEKFTVIVFAGDNENTITNGRVNDPTGRRPKIPPEYLGGIGKEGVENVKTFVRNGGTVITYGASNSFAINTFGLGVKNSLESIPREQRDRDISIPGSILKTINVISNPIAYGLPEEGSLFYFESAGLFTVANGKIVSRYPDTEDLLLSGWLEGASYVKGKANVVEIPYGEGRFVLIGFDPIYRAQAQQTFKYLFNALYLSAAKTGVIISK